ncbi:MAG: hypothetical protein M3541_13950 [Acidobacteriota bacterium]|nr:hypothetical protein [Acidobacteriota bacterium]MDQ3419858.1 hypothetical protein [Acidobacteriota bacterium]
MTPFRAALLLVALTVTACAAPRVPALPTGAGTPFPNSAAAYEEAVTECRDAKRIVAELGLSGRAGDQRLGGRIVAGFAEPSALRLEGVVLGRTIFILVSKDDDATLLLPRDERVVRDAPPEAIVEALAGVALTPAELRAAVAGCGLGAGTASSGRQFNEQWSAVEVGRELTYLRRVDGRWRVGGATRGPLRIVYADFSGGLPRTIHLRSDAPAGGTAKPVADITLRVSQLEINTAIDPRAFEVTVPPSALPLSVEELRRAGPLGAK